jgi:F-type H+-transporting ATPase subunit gamma
MASLKAIRRRISSVRSTQQITRAMKLVAAARLRRAQEALQNASPYHQALVRVADSLFATERAALGPAEDARIGGSAAVTTPTSCARQRTKRGVPNATE